jgi:hypothetical protein
MEQNGVTHIASFDAGFDEIPRVGPHHRVVARTRHCSARVHVPPARDNPLGAHWIGLPLGAIGIHGTTAPASIDRFQTPSPADLDLHHGAPARRAASLWPCRKSDTRSPKQERLRVAWNAQAPLPAPP